MNGESVVLENGLRLSVDWLSFTLPSEFSVGNVCELLGYVESDFFSCPKGAQGYLYRHTHPVYPITILSGGRDDMGIHVDIGGSALGDVLQHYRSFHSEPTPFGTNAYSLDDSAGSVFLDLLRDIHQSGSFTRIDLAVDDFGSCYYSVDDVKRLLDSGLVVSRFRSYRYYDENQLSGGCSGKTVYVGTRESEIMLRVYDKQLETNKKNAKSGSPLLASPWVRWELEIKDSRAEKAVAALLSGTMLSELVIGVLGNYVRFIVNDNARKSRCSIDPIWYSFLAGIESLRLFCKSEPKTLDDMKENVKRQYAPTLATIIACEKGDTSFLSELLHDGSQRLNNNQRLMIQQHSGGLA